MPIETDIIVMLASILVLPASNCSAGTIAPASPNNGPLAGKNLVAISGTDLGSGADITNVLLRGVSATIQPGQTATNLIVLAGACVSWGPGDILVQSTSRGTSLLTNGYSYNPPGHIFGDFQGWHTVSNLPSLQALCAGSFSSKAPSESATAVARPPANEAVTCPPGAAVPNKTTGRSRCTTMWSPQNGASFNSAPTAVTSDA